MVNLSVGQPQYDKYTGLGIQALHEHAEVSPKKIKTKFEEKNISLSNAAIIQSPLSMADKIIKEITHEIDIKDIKEKTFNEAITKLRALEDISKWNLKPYIIKILKEKANFYLNNKELDKVTREFLYDLTANTIQNLNKKV